MNSNSVNTIADRIVDLVEKAGKPITLAYIEREVPGFAEIDDLKLTWSYERGDDGDGSVVWDGMTAEGCEALGTVIRNGRIALCHCRTVVYLLEGRLPSHDQWTPVMLAPASSANLQGGRILWLLPDDAADLTMELVRTMSDGETWRRLHRA